MARKLIATSILTACLATTCLSYNGAAASDPELYFYPAKKWVVTKVEGEAQDSVCRVSNEFNNGFRMEFTGTRAGFKEVGVDFRSKTFEKGKKYEVVYQVPGVERKIIPGRATKTNMLVSDLRGKADFAEALKTASVLDFQIVNNEFRMYLTGFSKAMEEYNNCLFPPPPAMASIDQVENPPELIEQRQAAIEAQEKAEAALNAKDSMDAPIETYAMEVPAEEAAPPAQSELDEIIAASEPSEEQKKKDMEDIVAKATSMADDYKAGKSPSANDEPAQAEKPQRYTEQLAEELKRESEKYKPEPKKSKSNEMELNSKAAPSEDVVSVAEAPASAPAEEPIKAAKAEPVKESVTIPAYKVNKEVARVEADFTQVGKAPVEQGSGVDDSSLDSIETSSGSMDLRMKLKELEQEVYSLRKENKMLDQELKVSLKDSEEERMSVASDNWNLERATMRYNEAERQIMRLGRQLQTFKQQCEYEKQELKTMLFDPKVTEQQQIAKLSSLEEELSRTKSELEMTRRRYEERIRILQDQLESAGDY